MFNPISHFKISHFFGPLVILASFIAGCALPKAELNTYQESFSAARNVSEQILADYDAVKRQDTLFKQKTKAKKAEKEKPPPIPEDFNPYTASGIDKNPEITARVKAWETVARYNDVLVALAEGKNPEEVVNSFNALVDSVNTITTTLGTTFPLLGAGAPLIGSFLKLAEKARLHEEFSKAIETGEPIILNIIDILIKDTIEFYQLRRVLANRQIRNYKLIIFDHASSMTWLASQHSEPEGIKLQKAKQKMQDKLNDILKELDLADKEIISAAERHQKVKKNKKIDTQKLGDLTGQTDPSAPEYAELVQSQVVQLMDAIDEAFKKRQDTINDMLLFRELLHSYVLLLDKMKETLVAVRHKLNSPPEIRLAARELLATVISVRNQIAELSQAR